MYTQIWMKMLMQVWCWQMCYKIEFNIVVIIMDRILKYSAYIIAADLIIGAVASVYTVDLLLNSTQKINKISGNISADISTNTSSHDKKY